MLLGRPPFETTNLKETYRCIREARYSLPSSLSAQAKQLITNLLAKTPEDRPNLDLLLRHDFFTQVRHHCRPLWLSFPLSVCCCRYVFCDPSHSCRLTGFRCLQGFSPERLPASCCHSAPDFHVSSPAKSFFKKAAAALFGGRREKVKYYETLSKSNISDAALNSLLKQRPHTTSAFAFLRSWMQETCAPSFTFTAVWDNS